MQRAVSVIPIKLVFAALLSWCTLARPSGIPHTARRGVRGAHDGDTGATTTDTETQHPQGAARMLVLWRIKRLFIGVFLSRAVQAVLRSFILAVTAPPPQPGPSLKMASAVRAEAARGARPGSLSRKRSGLKKSGGQRGRENSGDCGRANTGKTPGIPGKTARLEGLSGHGERLRGRLVWGCVVAVGRGRLGLEGSEG